MYSAHQSNLCECGLDKSLTVNGECPICTMYDKHTSKMTKVNSAFWSKEFPTIPGLYWFYGYRYGKNSCGHECKPELNFVEVKQIANGMLYVANGTIMFKDEVEEAHFMPIDVPEFPELEN